MSYGFSINGTDLKTAYGLILLDDLSIGAPALKETRIEIPGMNGSLNASYALTGEPTFSDRAITGTLYIGADMQTLSALRAELMRQYHGRECSFIFPDDTSHAWNGVIQFGELAMPFRLPFSITAAPYKMALTDTTVTKSISTTPMEIVLQNDARPVVPYVTNNKEMEIEIGGETLVLAAGTDRLVPDLYIPAGGLTLSASVETGTGTLVLRYRQGAM